MSEQARSTPQGSLLPSGAPARPRTLQFLLRHLETKGSRLYPGHWSPIVGPRPHPQARVQAAKVRSGGPAGSTARSQRTVPAPQGAVLTPGHSCRQAPSSAGHMPPRTPPPPPGRAPPRQPPVPVRLSHILPRGQCAPPAGPLPHELKLSSASRRAHCSTLASCSAPWWAGQCSPLLQPPRPPPSPGCQLLQARWSPLRLLCPQLRRQPVLPTQALQVDGRAQTSSGNKGRCRLRGQAQPGYRISQGKDGEEVKGAGPQNRCECRAR